MLWFQLVSEWLDIFLYIYVDDIHTVQLKNFVFIQIRVCVCIYICSIMHHQSMYVFQNSAHTMVISQPGNCQYFTKIHFMKLVFFFQHQDFTRSNSSGIFKTPFNKLWPLYFSALWLCSCCEPTGAFEEQCWRSTQHASRQQLHSIEEVKHICPNNSHVSHDVRDRDFKAWLLCLLLDLWKA